MNKYDSGNKRQHPRIGHSMLTEVVQDGGQSQEAVAVDFSLSGVRLALTRPVAVDRPLMLQLRLPASDIDAYQHQEPLNLQARIAWQREEDGCLRCGAEFVGLSDAQKERLKEGFSLVKKFVAASIAGVLFPVAFASAQTAVPLSADILADQVAVKASTDKVQTNLSKVLQDVLNIQSNTAGSNNAGLNLIYNASLAMNVAALTGEGANLSKATQKLNTDASPILSANNSAIQKASAQFAADTKLGKTGNLAAMQKAAQQAFVDQQAIYGTLAPALTDKVQADIGTLAKNATKYGLDLIAKTSATDKAAALGTDKNVMAANFTALMSDVVAMKPVAQPTPQQAAATAATAAAANAATTFINNVGAMTVKQADGTTVSLATAATSFVNNVGTMTVKQADGTTVSLATAATSFVNNVGALTVKQSDGSTVSLSNMLSSLISGGIKAMASAVPASTSAAPKVMKLLDGSEVAYMQTPLANPADSLGQFGVNSEAPKDNRMGYAMLTDKAGTTAAIGYGYSVQSSYAKALFGSNDDLAQLSGQMGVSNLSGLAHGGGLFAYGTKLNDSTRLAVSWSGTAAAIDSTIASSNSAWSNAKASNLTVGVSHKFGDQTTGGVNVGFLNESHGILGSNYDPSSAMSLGETNRTMSLGFSAGFNLSKDSSLLFEVGFATTKGGNTTGLIAGTSDIQSRSYGMTFMSKNLLNDNDKLTVSMVQPLRVVSGQVAVVMPSIDSQGVTSYNKQWVSLAPTGHETDYKLSYDVPLKKNQSLNLQASARTDVLNMAGNKDASAGVSWSMKF